MQIHERVGVIGAILYGIGMIICAVGRFTDTSETHDVGDVFIIVGGIMMFFRYFRILVNKW